MTDTFLALSVAFFVCYIAVHIPPIVGIVKRNEWPDIRYYLERPLLVGMVWSLVMYILFL